MGQIKSESHLNLMLTMMEVQWDTVTAVSLMLLTSMLATRSRTTVSEQPKPPKTLTIRKGCIGLYLDGDTTTMVHIRDDVDNISRCTSEAIQRMLKCSDCDSGNANEALGKIVSNPKNSTVHYSGRKSSLSYPCTRQSELDCLVWGVNFALSHFSDECYTFRIKPDMPVTEAEPLPTSVLQWYKDVKDETEKIIIPHSLSSSEADQLPYLLVVLDEDVKIFKVHPSSSSSSITDSGAGCSYEPVTSSPIGGDSFLALCGLCCSLNNNNDTDITSTSRVNNSSGSMLHGAAASLAERGNCSGIDMSVQDIYGGDYGSLLVGAMTASSLGKITSNSSNSNINSYDTDASGDRNKYKSEDLAMSLLMTVTLNIGQLAVMSQQLTDCKGSAIYFTGSWLNNSSDISEVVSRRIAWSFSIWSGGKLQAHFLKSSSSNSSNSGNRRLKALGAWASAAVFAAPL